MGEEKEARAREEAEAKKVVNDLEKQIKDLEKTLAEKKKRNDSEIAKALKAAEAEEEKAETEKLSSKEVQQIKKRADESNKVVKYLKKENTRLKDETEQMEDDLAQMKETNNRLVEANATAGASLETLNKQAKVLKDHNQKLAKSIDDFRQANRKLDHNLKGRQVYYDAETKIQKDYEKAMEKIVKFMEDKCRDSALVEKVMSAQLKCAQNVAAAGGH